MSPLVKASHKVIPDSGQGSRLYLLGKEWQRVCGHFEFFSFCLYNDAVYAPFSGEALLHSLLT